MKNSLIQQIRHWTLGRTSRFLLSQLAHTAFTLTVLAALLLGAAQVGALNGLTAPAAPASVTSFTAVNYQGRLADSSGTPIDNTSPGLGMTFALYDTDTGGSPLWSETHANVPVSDGLFSVRLGSINALSTDLLTGDRWLAIQVGTDPEMAPREELSAVPYAMQSGLALTVADESIATEKIVDGAITSRKMAPSWYEDYNPSTTSTTSGDPVPADVSVTFTCDTDCTALILHRGLVQHSLVNGRTEIQILVDESIAFRELGVVNVRQGGGPVGSSFHAVQGFDFVNLAAGTHTVDVRFRCYTAGTCYYYGDSTGQWEHLNVLVFSQP